MHYALAAAFPGSKVLRAFDLNPVANHVYAANFGARPWQARRCVWLRYSHLRCALPWTR